jgi:glutaminase
MNIEVKSPPVLSRNETSNPLSHFLAQTHAALAPYNSGALANYIPELAKANPDHFGIAVATMDGHVYEIGDTAAPFTIQSVSKAFVFALALETAGPEFVESRIGVEPSGDAFNSIRLNAANRPFNAMVNAGAIACSAIIHEIAGNDAVSRVRESLSRFAGRHLEVDQAVYESERLTGDRNRAIAYLLHNYGIIKGEVTPALDLYFMQCSMLVTARDLALMAATLGNGGVHPITGERVVSGYTVSRTLSVMTSSGMYDYAGEWVYRVGLPAKSGVGGGIIATLPGQIGIGSFSPLLDEHGNSARGLKVCEMFSSQFQLHMLNRVSDVTTCIVADYDFARVSPRGRQPHEQIILDEHKSAVRVLELTGTLSFGNVDYIVRQIESKPRSQVLILDFSRVPQMSIGAGKFLSESLAALHALGVTTAISGVSRDSTIWARLTADLDDGGRLRDFTLLEDAIEWGEDQIIFRYGGFTNLTDTIDLAKQELLLGLPAPLVAEISRIGIPRSFHTSERIIVAGSESKSLYFLQRGMVSVKLPAGVRLATLVPGMAFGEMVLVEKYRSADVWADTAVECTELTLEKFDAFRAKYPETGEHIMRNLATLLSQRLGRANTRIELLTSK